MFNNRMLAVAAVLVMAVPALGAATPIVVPPVPEQLVEGHTVFTVIEIVRATQTNEVRFAAAVAVLVREYQAANNAQRFPGVLWFNDQYLVNPEQSANDYAAFRYPCGGAVIAVNQGDPDPRVVIARINTQPTTVQADLPDGVDDNTGDVDETVGVGGLTYGDSEYTYSAADGWVKPYPGTYQYENDYAWIGGDVGPSTVNATDGTAGTSATLYSDTVVGTVLGDVDGNFFNASAPWDYRESYLITDPNDHAWVIDKYEFYTRDSFSTASGPDSQNVDNLFTKLGEPVPAQSDGYVSTEHYPEAFGGMLRTEYAYPVWVVNMLGSPVFIPDNGVAVRATDSEFIGENCVPFKDLVEDPCGYFGVEDTINQDIVNGTLGQPDPGFACPELQGATCASGSGLDIVDHTGAPPWTDNPCMSYREPSRNGFCYGGQEDIGPEDCADVHGTPGNDRPHYKNGVRNEPFRQYNALLYFKLEDLRVFDGTLKDHCNFDATVDSDPVTPGIEGGCNPANSPDTNGCSEEQYPWGPNPPQAANDWPCPGNDDDAEGNSHPFHPTTPPHLEAEPCLPAFSGAAADGQDGYRRNPSNHGGSSYVTPSNRATDEGWYQVYAPCDYMHTTRNIDVYFSPGGRPFPPVLRYFDVVDLEGSSAPFQDFHNSYPGVA